MEGGGRDQRVRPVTEPNPGGGADYIMSYTYDSLNRLASATATGISPTPMHYYFDHFLFSRPQLVK